MSFLQSPYHIGSHGRMTAWVYGGSISGFAISGANHHDAWCGGCGTGIWYMFNDIWSISLTTDGNAVDSGGSELRTGFIGGAVSGVTHSYTADGSGQGGSSEQISRFANTNAGAGSTDVGDLTTTVNRGVGISSIGNGHGYHGHGTTLQKYAFGSSSNATNVSALVNNHGVNATSSSDGVNNYGYVHAGYLAAPVSTAVNVMSRFSFDNEATKNDVGDMAVSGGEYCGGSSETRGYMFGSGQIYSYTFAAGGNGVDVGNLINGHGERGTGFSSTTHSYASGGGVHETHMEKFAHASHSTSSFVGNLGTGQTTNRTGHVSTHY